MKNLLLVLMLACVGMLSAQTSGQLGKTRTDALSQDVSANNPWLVNAKLSFAVKDLDGSLENAFVFSGSATTNLAKGERYAFPLYFTAGLGSGDIFANESGFNAGVYPWYSLVKSENFELVAHAGAAYKVIPSLDTLQAFTQFRLTGGLEASYYVGEASLPTTLSISPAYLWNDEILSTATLEATLIIPVSNGVGVLFEYEYPFEDGFEDIFRIGIITVGIL